MKTALVCIAKDEDSYIHEWIDYHLKLGFDDIYVYKNDWNYTINKKNVFEENINGEVKQLESYHKFIRENYKNYDWAAFFDVDEFLVLKKDNNVKEFINNFNRKTDCIAINWVFFGNNGHEKLDKSDYSLLKRFTKRAELPDEHIKIICRLKSENLRFSTPHNLNNIHWMDTNNTKGTGPFNKKGNIEIAQLNHYVCKTMEEYKIKIKKGRADIADKNQSRKLEHYNIYNKNEVDDFLARDYLYNK
jgi:hypothetical protein